MQLQSCCTDRSIKAMIKQILKGTGACPHLGITLYLTFSLLLMHHQILTMKLHQAPQHQPDQIQVPDVIVAVLELMWDPLDYPQPHHSRRALIYTISSLISICYLVCKNTIFTTKKCIFETEICE